jgi:hypothetical protein
MDTKLIESLRNPALYPFPVAEVRLIETHISWVLLTGTFAYKIKKPVNLGFLDFSTLALREKYCREELRLNSRFAPQLYLDVVPIAGSPESPQLDGPGTPIEFAVRMREFRSDERLDAVLARGELHAADMDRLAAELARMHAAAPRADASSPFGAVDAVFAPALENFAQIRARDVPAELTATLAHVEAWTLAQRARLQDRIAARKHRGMVRECHGDLHSRNIAWIDGRFVPFDAIEFNPGLRWIDVVSELAFAVMDLEADHSPDCARRLANAYFELTGDYDGLALMPFYLCYRAMVRAKVAILGASDADAARREKLLAQLADYLALAQRYTRAPRPALIVMHGVSGSGKSTAALHLVETLGAIRVRSDYERKRIAPDFPALALYSRELSGKTYARLNDLAATVLDAGYTAILDATYLSCASRATALDVARRDGVPAIIVGCTAPDDVLRARVIRRAQRASDISDADVAVLDQQLATREPLTPDERRIAIPLSGTDAPALASLTATLAAQIDPGHDAHSR